LTKKTPSADLVLEYTLTTGDRQLSTRTRDPITILDD